MECTVSDLWNIEPLIQYSFTLIRQPTFVLYKQAVPSLFMVIVV